MPRYRTNFRAWQELGDDFRDRLSAFPELKREFLTLVAKRGRQLILAEYMFQTPGDLRYSKPTKDTGLYGEQLVTNIAVGPKRSWATITARAPYSDFVEQGRGPGGVDVGALQDWASRKFGLDPESEDTRRIINKIRFAGIQGRRLFYYALDPNTSSGRMYSDFIGAAGQDLLDRITVSTVRRGSRGMIARPMG